MRKIPSLVMSGVSSDKVAAMPRQPAPACETEIVEFISDLLEVAEQINHRHCVVISGDEKWVQATIATVLSQISTDVHWVRDRKAHLGEETSTLVINAFEGFNPDIFAAVSGSLRGGGLLFLLTPALKDWADFNDPEYKRISVFPVAPEQMTGRFLRRYIRILRNHRGTLIIEQNAPLPRFTSGADHKHKEFIDPVFRSEDQKQAVIAIQKVISGHRRRPLVITSDRGRGKSAVLGIAAAQIMEQGIEHIMVTSSRLDAVAILFEQAEKNLPAANVSRGLITTRHSRLEFQPPDRLLHDDHKTRLLLVDEAATIPTPQLTRLLTQYSRIVFASTIHGYEGTGRGFATRFQQTLDQKTPGWRSFQLHKPIRWNDHDPLEDLVFQTLLLDAAPAAESAINSARKNASVLEQLNRQLLANDEETLRQLFGLLTNAHYQTRPTDLRYLLDGPNLSIYVLRTHGNIVATALIATEGGFDETMAVEITQGKRRPHGHLIPETLASHMGLGQAPLLRCARIVRIAIHPAMQGQGWGSLLLAKIHQHPSLVDLDYFAASFGARPELLDFWERSGYQAVRVGIQRNASSGEHSVVVLKPGTSSGKQLFVEARERFFRQFCHQLSDSLRDLEAELVLRLLAKETGSSHDLDVVDVADLSAFSRGHRVYEACSGTIWKFTCWLFMQPRSDFLLDRTQTALLIHKVLQKHDWKTASSLAGLSGKKTAIKMLCQSVSKQLSHIKG